VRASTTIATKRERADFALWKSAETGRTFWRRRSAVGAPAGTLSVPRWHEISRRDTDIHTRRNRPGISASRKRNCAGEGATGSLLRGIGCMRAFACRRREDVEVAGEFLTLRDLFAKGYKPSALRFALASVPYRKQLKFHVRWSAAGASSVERLRNFADRLKRGKFSRWQARGHGARIAKQRKSLTRGLPTT